jgi:F420H(2)-dependent quinone reductase
MSARTVTRALARFANDLHVRLYRRTQGRRGGRVQGVPMLLLTATGRRTGQARTRPLGYLRDGDCFVVVGSNGGSHQPPAWWLNLGRNPAAHIEVGPDRLAVIASEATGEDYARLWRKMTDQYPVYKRYPDKAKRHIPVIVLEPARGGDDEH